MTPRNRARVWIGVASAPVVLLALALVVKLIAMYAFAYQAADAYARDDMPAAVQAAERQSFLNWFEPWKAPYNAGVGLAASDDLTGAQAEFEQALPLASGMDQCPVRLNLSLVLEWQGDEQAGAAARDLYDQALVALAGAPAGCAEDPRYEQLWQDAEQRLKQKQEEAAAQAEQQQDDPQAEGSDGDAPSQGQLDDLEDQLREGQAERDGMGQDDGSSTGDGSGVEKPW
ncbi:hypothetical protein [Microbacterium indicum]|uniref:hypothetical protein n=1 Tax=Microbacterium indicum TaxID=358100 RepID=UPI0003FBDD87|nr:hypothetical protein [Microbacterium indicum]